MLARWWYRLGVVGLALTTVLLVSAAPASAHPLGNFTTNRYARVEVGATVVRVHYVLDEAELVAFRSRDAIASNAEAVASARLASISSGLTLTVQGRPVTLQPVSHRLTTPAGQGGLTTLRLEAVFQGALPDVRDGGSAEVDATFSDRNGPDLVGWREVVVRGVDGAKVLSSSAPTTDVTNGLRSYPSDPSVRPLDVRSAIFAFRPSTGGVDGPVRLGAERGRLGGATGDRFVRLVADTASSPLAIAGALLIALLVGAAHALGPGHGKTVMAAYLVSTSGRRRDAIWLGVVVSLMHTASVLVLAVLLATVGRRFEATQLYPTLTLVAGLLVVGVGLNLLRTRRAAARSTPVALEARRTEPARVLVSAGARVSEGEHPPDHDHDHDHGHGHGHAHGGRTHSHALPADVRPLSRAGLLALGTSGGLFPSPSAVVVLVGAFVAGRAALGLALIASFSVGLASVLVAVGLLLVAGRDRLRSSRFALALPWLPTAGATAIVALGVVLAVQGGLQLR